MITPSGTVYLHYIWCFGGSMNGIEVVDNANPTIKGCLVAANKQGNGLKLTTSGSTYSIIDCTIKTLNSVAIDNENGNVALNVFDCLLDGSVDSNIKFTSKSAVNGSSNYSI